MKEIYKVASYIAVFLAVFFLPTGAEWLLTSLQSSLELLNEYAREHVLTCLLPALFIAGGLASLVRKQEILKYLGDKTSKIKSYLIASTSGILLAVCSCTILPLFASIRRNGAGLGPASTFLLAGPAINIAAIMLTISVLGVEIGIARMIAAIIIAVLVGLTMSYFFKEEFESNKFHLARQNTYEPLRKALPLFLLLITILIVTSIDMPLIIMYSLLGIIIISIIGMTLTLKKESKDKWLEETWSFSKLILPLLFIGIFIVGFITPLIPDGLIENIAGENTVQGNFISGLFGVLMYFSTLTEIPILQTLINEGMHKGPALTLLLAGPSVSLPNMLVIRSILGNKKTLTYIALTLIYSTIAGLTYGFLF